LPGSRFARPPQPGNEETYYKMPGPDTKKWRTSGQEPAGHALRTSAAGDHGHRKAGRSLRAAKYS